MTIDGATLNSNHYAGGIVAWVLNSRGNIQVPMVIENCHVKNSTITSTPIQINGEFTLKCSRTTERSDFRKIDSQIVREQFHGSQH